MSENDPDQDTTINNILMAVQIGANVFGLGEGQIRGWHRFSFYKCFGVRGSDEDPHKSLITKLATERKIHPSHKGI
ncbi:hypothetical protein GDO81_022563 [Engystomops pustulosus]|uniref:Uncharacterized protein n=1 Tax=Engystomops pustulosus TaxID=76066 RepID=A0AAV6ZID4_ENGPU|nr:hypothetical protein GDO81_022563 [Engystomops pustulosus]